MNSGIWEVNMKRKVNACLGAVVLFVCTLTIQTPEPLQALPGVILTGDHAPVAGEAVFASLGAPSLNNLGDVAFRASLKGTPSVRNGVFYVPYGGAPEKVAVSGEQAVDSPVAFSNFSEPSINDHKQVAFAARLGRGFERNGLFLYTNGAISSICVTGQQAPGVDGTFSLLGRRGIALDNKGNITFEASFTGPHAGNAVFRYSDGKLEPILVPAHTLSPQGKSLQQVLGFSVNQAGDVAVAATINGSPVTQGVFTVDGTSGNVTQLATTGQSAPYPDASGLGSVYQPSIDDRGNVAFVDAVTVQGRLGATLFPRALLLGASGQLSLLAGIVGKGPGVLRGNIQRPSLVTDGSTSAVLFVAWHQQWGINGLFLYRRGTLSLLTREGDATVAGGVHSFIGNAVLTSAGYYAFVSNLAGASARAGIFVNKMTF
jgi:hypothetical protein